MDGPEKYCIPWSNPDSGMRMSHVPLCRLIVVHILEILYGMLAIPLSAKARKMEGTRQREGVGIAGTMDSKVEERMLGAERSKLGEAWKKNQVKGGDQRVCEKATQNPSVL